MVKLYEDGIYLRGGSEVVPAAEAAERGITQTPEDAKRGTIAYSILQAHNTSGDPEALKIRFDAMASKRILSASGSPDVLCAWRIEYAMVPRLASSGVCVIPRSAASAAGTTSLPPRR